MRAGKQPEAGLSTGLHGSDKWPQRPAFRAVPAGPESRKKTVPTEETGGRGGFEPSVPDGIQVGWDEQRDGSVGQRDVGDKSLILRVLDCIPLGMREGIETPK